ncbi:L-xylulose reductase isoform X3 [Rousettus aegyptiacus]|uniref:L-xylulose reductase isoform X3 n=1 Tax=Rousettus aegyptiacus TaxID=9407 RepID=UPI00168D78A8|nr:L-xylulose reductase isoform X3 [Rousettus aegyptiacus]
MGRQSLMAGYQELSAGEPPPTSQTWTAQRPRACLPPPLLRPLSASRAQSRTALGGTKPPPTPPRLSSLTTPGTEEWLPQELLVSPQWGRAGQHLRLQREEKPGRKRTSVWTIVSEKCKRWRRHPTELDAQTTLLRGRSASQAGGAGGVTAPCPSSVGLEFLQLVHFRRVCAEGVTRDPGVIGTATGFLSRERTGPPRPRAGLTPAPARPIPIQRLSSECDVTSSFTPSCSYTATEMPPLLSQDNRRRLRFC